MTATINGREMQVSEMPTPEFTRQSLQARGWDGQCYLATGKRGAAYLVYRSATTGAFSIAAKG